MRRSSSTPKAPSCVSAYVSDDEVDENGNPLPDEDTEAPANDEAGQVPIEASVVSEEDTADETGDDNETKTK